MSFSFFNLIVHGFQSVVDNTVLVLALILTGILRAYTMVLKKVNTQHTVFKKD